MSKKNRITGKTSRCIVANCYPDAKASLATLPKDWGARILWLRILNREDLLEYTGALFVCFKHFKPEMFGLSGRILTRTALPFLGVNPEQAYRGLKNKQPVPTAPEPTPKQEAQDLFKETVFRTSAGSQTEEWMVDPIDKEKSLLKAIAKLEEQVKTATAVNETLIKESTSIRTFLKQGDAYLSDKVFDMVKEELRANNLMDDNDLNADADPVPNICIFRRKDKKPSKGPVVRKKRIRKPKQKKTNTIKVIKKSRKTRRPRKIKLEIPEIDENIDVIS